MRGLRSGFACLLVVSAAAALTGLAIMPQVRPAAASPAYSGPTLVASRFPTVWAKTKPTPTPSPSPTPTPTPMPHTGVAVGDSLQPAVARKWTRDLGSSVSYPLMAQGLIFVTTGNTDQTGLGQSSPAQLYALDQASGQTVWGPVQVGDGSTWANATYDAGRVFVLDRVGVWDSS